MSESTARSDRPHLRARARRQLTDGGGLLLVGEAGIGKTRLAGQVLADVSPGRVVRLRASPTSGHLGIFEQLVPPSSARADRPHGFDILERILGDASERETVMHVDDVHDLDVASAEYLAELSRFHGVRLVLTSRLAPGPPDAVTALVKDGLLERLDLPRLDEDAQHELAAARCAPATLDPATAQRLVDQAQGNPMHLLALIDTLVAAGDLHPQRDLLVWTGPLPRHGSIVDVIRPEIARLDDDARRALDAVALLGPLRPWLIVALAGADGLAALERSGLVEREDDGGAQPALRVAHPLYGEVARTMLTTSRERELLRAAVDAAAPRTVDDAALAVRSVRWSLAAGEVPDAALVAGLGTAVTGALDLEHAVDLATARLLLASDDGSRARAHADRALVQRALGRIDAAQQDAGAALRLARPLLGRARAEIVAHAAVALSEVAMTRTGDAAAMTAALDEARRDVADHPDLAVGLELNAAGKLAYAGLIGESVERFELLLEDVRLDERLLPAYGLAAVMAGRVRRAHDVVQRYLREAAAPTTFDAAMLGSALANLVGMGVASGLVDEAAAALGQLHAGMAPGMSRAELQPILALDAIVAVAQGRWVDAETAARSASAQFDSLDGSGLLRISLAALTLALAAQGRREAAEQIRTDAVRVAGRSNGVVEPLAASMLLHADLWLREPTVAADSDAVAVAMHERGALLGEVRALHARSLATPDGPAVVEERLAAAVARVDAPVAVAALHHVRARITKDAGEAELAVRELARTGLVLPAPGLLGVLSGREHEIASMASLGLSTKAIATRLVLSPRTVETHLTRAFTKLGVTSRDDLARVFRGR